MSSRSFSVSPQRRVEAIVSILSRGGNLTKLELDTKVAAFLGCTPQDISAELTSDLENLKAKKQVICRYFSSTGQPIAKHDPAAQTALCFWSAPQDSDLIPGAERLHALKLSIRASQNLLGDISVGHSSDFPLGRRWIALYGKLPSGSFHILVEDSARPFKIFFGRNLPPSPKPFLSNAEENRFGDRSILIGVPFSDVSSYKPDKKMCHMHINFTESDEVYIHDFKSTNGTFIQTVPQLTIEEEIKSYLLVDRPKHSPPPDGTEKHNLGKIKSLLDTTLNLPAKVNISREFTFLVCTGG